MLLLGKLRLLLLCHLHLFLPHCHTRKRLVLLPTCCLPLTHEKGGGGVSSSTPSLRYEEEGVGVLSSPAAPTHEEEGGGVPSSPPALALEEGEIPSPGSLAPPKTCDKETEGTMARGVPRTIKTREMGRYDKSNETGKPLRMIPKPSSTLREILTLCPMVAVFLHGMKSQITQPNKDEIHKLKAIKVVRPSNSTIPEGCWNFLTHDPDKFVYGHPLLPQEKIKGLMK